MPNAIVGDVATSPAIELFEVWWKAAEGFIFDVLTKDKFE